MSRRTVLLCIFLFLLQACGRAAAPVQQRDIVKQTEPGTTQRGVTVQQRAARVDADAGYHAVEKGDTLYSIAWRYNKDYKSLASWNRISAPYTIYPGQIIRLKPSPQKATTVVKKKGTPLEAETVKKLPSRQTTSKQPVKNPTPPEPAKKIAKSVEKTALPSGPIKWSWPTTGKLVKSNSPTSKKGIDISGKTGQTIKAAAPGDVVYSGSGLFGYGKLIIIKHNETYLSAYAYNSKLLVKEGDRVRAGQPISHMGQDHTGRTVLHFEIRKNGKPINPVSYLPRKSA